MAGETEFLTQAEGLVMSRVEDRGLARMGCIVPVSNTNLEPDMVRICPQGMSVHFARAGGYDIDQVPDSAQMIKLAESSLEPVLDQLVATRPDIIAYGCTSATLAKGPKYDAEFRTKIEQLSGVPAITAASALCHAVISLGIKSVAFGSPYTQQLNQEGADFLNQSGLEVVHIPYIGRDLGNYGQSELTPDQVYRLGLDSNHDDAEGLVLSCTDMRAVEVIDALEDTLGKPVISSNQALMFQAAEMLKMCSRIPGQLGRI